MSLREKVIAHLQEMGVDPKRSLGQNFLISERVVERILQSAKLLPCTSIVEVGPGLGALTEPLIAMEKPFVAIELDRGFSQLWRERGVQLIEGDALQIDWSGLNLPEGTLLVSNLPYQISSSLVVDRSIQPFHITRMILMFQKEVAQRLVARIRTKEYGLLSVIAQTFWRVDMLLEAGPGEFYPAPQIASRVMTFQRKDSSWENQPGASAKGFLRFAKAGFSHRRKLLVNNLSADFFNGDKLAAKQLEERLLAEGLSIQARAEELDCDQFLRLYLFACQLVKS
jgi:16S rRNA (adenine1518-N6/adenine1519-N6)-dimethyltransferase